MTMPVIETHRLLGTTRPGQISPAAVPLTEIQIGVIRLTMDDKPQSLRRRLHLRLLRVARQSLSQGWFGNKRPPLPQHWMKAMQWRLCEKIEVEFGESQAHLRHTKPLGHCHWRGALFEFPGCVLQKWFPWSSSADAQTGSNDSQREKVRYPRDDWSFSSEEWVDYTHADALDLPKSEASV